MAKTQGHLCDCFMASQNHCVICYTNCMMIPGYLPSTCDCSPEHGVRAGGYVVEGVRIKAADTEEDDVMWGQRKQID